MTVLTMNFDKLMAQARKNEEISQKSILSKPVNLEPPRPTKKVRAEIVQRQEEERKRQEAERMRIARLERDKLQKMEAELKERERKMAEEEAKQERLMQIHREAQERRAKLDGEMEKQREEVRKVAEKRKNEDREKKQREREKKRGYSTEKDIFRRRQEEISKQNRYRQQRKEEQEQREREKKIRMREQARLLAKSLSKPLPPPPPQLPPVDDDFHDNDKKDKTVPHKRERSLSLSDEQQLNAGNNGKLIRDDSSSEDDEEEEKKRAPNKRRKVSSSTSLMSEQSAQDTETDKPRTCSILETALNKQKELLLKRHLDVLSRYPDVELEGLSDAEYDSHDEHASHVTSTADVISNISKETANLFQETVVSETINFSPLDTVFTETLTSITTIPNSSPKNKAPFYSPHSVTSTSEFFKESLVSETTYSPQPIQDDPVIPINYSPSAVPAKYVPENFSCDTTTSVLYSPFTGNDQRNDSFSFPPVSSSNNMNIATTDLHNISCDLLNVSSNEGEETVVSETQTNSPEERLGNKSDPYSSYNTDITETLVSETAESPAVSSTPTNKQQSHYSSNHDNSNVVVSSKDEYSPKAIDDQVLNTLCYSPINPEDLEQLAYSPTPIVGNNVSRSHDLSGDYDKIGDKTSEIETVTSETKYSPQNLTGEQNLVAYTPARKDSHVEEKKVTNEGSPILSPYQNSIEMTPNETEMVCEEEGNQSDSDDSDESDEEGKRKRKQRIHSDDSTVNTSNETVSKANSGDGLEDEDEKQARLQELFGDETESEGERKDNSDEVKRDKNNEVEDKEEDEEEEEQLTSKQKRRNKLKELARKKGRIDSDDDLSDYDHKRSRNSHSIVEPSAKKPKNFTELMELAHQKAAESRKSLERIKEEERLAEKKERELELKKKNALKALEQQKLEREKEKRKALIAEKLRMEEKAKNRIPKVRGDVEKNETSSKTHDASHKLKDSSRRQPDSSKANPAPRTTQTSKQHPDKRKRQFPPKGSEGPRNSFEELMKMANQNSESKQFGSNVKSVEEHARSIMKARQHKKDALGLKEKVRQKSPPHRSNPSNEQQDRPRGHISSRDQQGSRDHGRVRERAPDTHMQCKEKPRHNPPPSRKDEPRRREEPGPNKRHHDKRKEVRDRREQKPTKKKFHMNPYMDDDDDMDGFIDDSGEGSVDVSKAIRSMFGYDRRKYLDEDDDSSDMEVGYGAIAAEEARSSRIAKKEDAEEYAKILAEEKRRRERALMKKR